MEKVLFSLIRLGLGTSRFEKEDISLLLAFSEKQWLILEEMSRNQGVSAIVMDGLQVVIDQVGNECFKHFEDKAFWSNFILNWAYGTVVQGYEKGNAKQLSVISDIQERWCDAGISMLLMKGQAMGTYYPHPEHRSPGDIDCYLFSDYAKGNEVAKRWADKVDEDWYKHSVISYRGQSIENHQYFVHTREGRTSKQLNQQLCDTLKDVVFDKLPGTEVLLPPPMFNALFLTYHAFSHFLEEGLRLKQLIDWAVFLKQDADKVDWPLLYSWCDKYHFRRFVDIATDAAVNCFGVQINNPKIITSSPLTEKVIHSTLFDQDYVFSNLGGGWNKRWHIIMNLVKYRWKYHQIYQHSIIRQLWFYFIGFVFKTE